MHSEGVMLLDNSELQLMYWLLVDAYSASRVLEAIFVALRQKSVSIINGQSFWGVNKCLLQRTGKHSAPTWQLAELDPGFRGGSAQKIFSLLIKKKMIWQFIAQKYIFHLHQEAWHSLCWRLAPARIGRMNYNGCILEAEGLDDLEMCVDEVLRDVGWNLVSPKTWRVQKPGDCIWEEFRSYLIVWDARDVSSGPGLAAEFPCDFRAGVQKGLGIYRTE